MPAYVIFVRDTPIRDEAEMAEYQRLAIAGMASGEHKVISRIHPGPAEALEGEAPTGVVMLEFPTMEEARAWYHSPGYQAAAPHRKAATDYRVFLVEGR
jgi:uncharacterized protein (DUF1330 family)